ncbi:MAG TPA: LLM class F420-dependent oxidoreductase [Actinomycetota bacterium]|nr:LLM class F420-dependent oxidoreductase [Actinomycetota bacterium]
MRLGLNLGYWGSIPVDQVALAQAADKLGFHSVWTAEAYGSDVLTPLAWVAAKTENINVGTAIMQMPARQPTAAAMAAATLDQLTGGRMLIGIGASGPQVSEGWYGVPYGKPLKRTREYVHIIREVLKREGPFEFHGEYYDIPVKGGTGLGKPLKLITKPLRSDIPIYLAAIGPKNVALAAEIAEGWLPVFYSPYRTEIHQESLENGFAKSGKNPDAFDIAASCVVIMGDDIDGCRSLVKPHLALYIGGMGARGKNFYNDLACRMGYEAAAKEIQDLYLDGKKDEATAAVPDEFVDEVTLCGPKERIIERLEAWKSSNVTTLVVSTIQTEVLDILAEAL